MFSKRVQCLWNQTTSSGPLTPTSQYKAVAGWRILHISYGLHIASTRCLIFPSVVSVSAFNMELNNTVSPWNYNGTADSKRSNETRISRWNATYNNYNGDLDGNSTDTSEDYLVYYEYVNGYHEDAKVRLHFSVVITSLPFFF